MGADQVGRYCFVRCSDLDYELEEFIEPGLEAIKGIAAEIGL